jgi:Domain of unknown function (DUF4157)/Novel toxin 15
LRGAVDSQEADDEEVARKRRIAPGKLTALEGPPRWRAHESTGGLANRDEHRAAPGHLSLFEREVARAEEAPPMSPATALHYASWLLAPERGWAEPAREEQVRRGRAGLRSQLRVLLQPSLRESPAAANARRTSSAPAFRLAARGLSSADALGAAEADGRLEAVLALVEACGDGNAMSAELAARMQAELGHSFSQVRLHDDASAAEACAILGAQAFTLGHHVYFAAGQLSPESEEGARLLRHELTHVIQHARGELRAGEKAELLSPSSSAEAEARAAEAPRPQPNQRLAPGWAGAPAEPSLSQQPTLSTVEPARPYSRPMPDWAGGAPAPTSSANTSAATAAPLALRAAAPAQSGAKPAAPALATVVNLAASFAPPADVAAHIEKAGPAGAGVKVRLPGVTQTAVIQVKKVDGRYVTVEETPQLVPLSHPLFAYAGKLAPVLRVRIGSGAPGAVTGYLTTAATAADSGALQKLLAGDLSALGLRGFVVPKLTLANSLSGGVLDFGLGAGVSFSLGGWVNGQLTLGLNNDKLSFEAKAAIHARGLQEAEITFSRSAKGALTGNATIGVALGENFTGKVNATYQNGDISMRGELGYHSEKLSGKLSVVLADADEAEAMVRSELPADAVLPAGQGAAGGKDAKPGKGKRGIAGSGTLDFAFTDWLTGSAKVVYGPSGHLTVVGKIAPPKQIDLMKTPKGVNIPILPEVKIEACYGLPYIANVHVGIGVALNASAGLGPIYMTDLALDGIYSTDPKVLNKFSITGTLRAQADAGLTLTLKGYAGLTVLGHSVNFGAEVLGKAGIKAYAEARTTLGYREKAAPKTGKKGEYYLQGHLEMAAQPALSLGGNLFIELDSPWWSPAPDKKWTWPLGSLEYPLPGQFGIGADVDYVVGSGQFPDVKLTKPSFDASKFVDSMMSSNLPARSSKAGKQEKKGTWGGQAPAKPTEAKPVVKPSAKPDATPKAGTPTTKPAKGNQSEAEQKAVPANQEVAKRWNAGMQALGDLRKRAEKDPETKEEIDKHLAEIKAKHGFTKLTPTLSGKVWKVDAAMNPDASLTPKKETFEVKADLNDANEGEKDKDGKDGKDGKEDAQGVAFEPITVRAEMPGGHEPVRVQPSTKQGKGQAELWIANQKGLKRIDDIADGPLGRATNQAGLIAVRKSLATLLPIEGALGAVKTDGGRVSQSALATIQAKVQSAVAEVSALGRKLRTNSLEGANHTRPMTNRRTVSFQKPDPATWKKEYIGKFIAEMVRQLKKQEEGLGKLTIDAWVVNREVFDPSDHLNELHETAREEVKRVLKVRCDEGLPRAQARLQKLQARKQQVEAALQMLEESADATPDEMKAAMEKASKATKDISSVSAEIQGYLDTSEQVAAADSGGAMDPKKMAGAGGRENGQAAWANKHRKAKAALVKLIKQNDPLVADWQGIVDEVGKLAVLHDPDQIAGGQGEIPALPVIKEPRSPSDSDGHEAWREYLAKVKSHLGVLDINSSLGAQWKNHIEKLYTDVIKDPDNPQEAYGIRTLNVKLIPE